MTVNFMFQFIVIVHFIQLKWCKESNVASVKRFFFFVRVILSSMTRTISKSVPRIISPSIVYFSAE